MAERRTIWKFPLAVTDVQHITVPRGARFLSAQMQDGQLVAWALVDDTAFRESWAVRIIGTGHRVECRDLWDMRFLATAQDGPFVWHVFVPDDAPPSPTNERPRRHGAVSDDR